MNGPKYKDWHEGKIINHETGKPESRTDYLLDEDYRANESDLPKIPVSEKEAGDMAFYDEMGKHG